jgi:two-component system sensor histidine kinase ChvG
MVQQGRLLAAALAERGTLESTDAKAILIHLDRRVTARLRVVDWDGRLLADSSRLGPRRQAGGADEPLGPPPGDPRASWLYRSGATLFRVVAPLFGGQPTAPTDGEGFYRRGEAILGTEVQAALHGRYGATTRVSPGQRSLTLYSAIPIEDAGEVVGAVLVSQSTYRVLQDLYEERLAIFQVFLISVGVAAVLSLLVATTIARPIHRLRLQAAAVLDRSGRLRGRFRASARRDEIGDLARALEELSRRLESRIGFMESFAADVSHEFKNPLASIRAAAEMLSTARDSAERERYLMMVESDVARLERTLSTLREVTRLDAELPEEEREPVDLVVLLAGLAEGFRVQLGERVRIEFEACPGPVVVRVDPDRLGQALENLIDNARGFAPVGSVLRIELERVDDEARIRVLDEGPGIPPEHLDRIFDRFFSWRPGEASGDHTGLGLAIARTVVEGYGGRLSAANREGSRGASFEVCLPVLAEA